MSENLDVVRSIYADWERGDFSSTALADPEIEFVIAEGPDSGRWKGVAGVVEAWRDFLGAWEGYRVKVDEYRELDSERVFVLTQRIGRGKTSGVEVGQMRAQGASLFHVRNGKVTRFVVYFDRDRALADLGLEG